MKRLATIVLTCLSTAACTTMEEGYPVAGLAAADVTGSVVAEPVGAPYELAEPVGFDDPEGDYCYLRGPDGRVLYQANRPAIGRC